MGLILLDFDAESVDEVVLVWRTASRRLSSSEKSNLPPLSVVVVVVAGLAVLFVVFGGDGLGFSLNSILSDLSPWLPLYLKLRSPI